MYEIVCAERTFYIPRNKAEESSLPKPGEGGFADPQHFEWEGGILRDMKGSFCYRERGKVLKINTDDMKEVMESVDIPTEGLDVVARITTPEGTVFQRYPVKKIGNRLTIWDFIVGESRI
jgi:hypothetical protein